jgi:hypothetical protein
LAGLPNQAPLTGGILMLYDPPAAGLLPGMLSGRLMVFPFSDIYPPRGSRKDFKIFPAKDFWIKHWENMLEQPAEKVLGKSNFPVFQYNFSRKKNIEPFFSQTTSQMRLIV